MSAVLKRPDLSVADDVTWAIHVLPAGVDIVFHKIARESMPLATLILGLEDVGTLLRDLQKSTPINVDPSAGLARALRNLVEASERNAARKEILHDLRLAIDAAKRTLEALP